jgi:hypothetical protein
VNGGSILSNLTEDDYESELFSHYLSQVRNAKSCTITDIQKVVVDLTQFSTEVRGHRGQGEPGESGLSVEGQQIGSSVNPHQINRSIAGKSIITNLDDDDDKGQSSIIRIPEAAPPNNNPLLVTNYKNLLVRWTLLYLRKQEYKIQLKECDYFIKGLQARVFDVETYNNYLEGRGNQNTEAWNSK